MGASSTSLKAFMRGLIDYAGLFPPAKLPLEAAVANYRRYLDEADAWMLSRFIIPATQLAGLTTLVRQQNPGCFRSRWTFSVLGQGGAHADAFLTSLETDVKAVTGFRRIHGENAVLDTFECRLPANPEATGMYDLVRQAADLLIAHGLRPFFETPAGADWPARAAAAIEAIARHNPSRTPDQSAGFKLRCGGDAGAAFPSPERVAFAIAACRDADVPLKATAGLHHPVRRFDAGVQTEMHGFFNVFGAGILARVHPLDRQTIQTIIEDETPLDFAFTDDGFAWRGLRATSHEITVARQQALISYGSCSFDEPREDLRTLGLL